MFRNPRLSRRSWLWGCAATALTAQTARAQLEVDIDLERVEPIPVAVSLFAPLNPGASELSEQIADIVTADLNRSGLFRVIDRAAYLQQSVDMNPFPAFSDWRLINAQALVSGTVQRDGDGSVRVEYRLWDVLSEQQMRAQRLEAQTANIRRIAHRISDGVYERITGEAGYFDTRIVFISETGSNTERVKNLAVIDQDGFNQQSLTAGNNLMLSPNIAPDGNRLAYITYHQGGPPRIFEMDLSSGRQSPLVETQSGMTFSPRYAPDSTNLLFSLARDGNTEIYRFDLSSRRSTRLSRHPAIDTSPSYAPDGQRICFNSDRGGSAQLYVMNRDGGNVQRISFGAGRYGSPAWSPRGDYIAFTKIKDSLFHIGVMRPDGSDERLITRSFFDEQPSWAPNGRTIVFTRQDPSTDRSALFTIDWNGYNLAELPTKTDASDADWAPLIP